ncbi:MAG: DUF1292 domain-containing protein [Lachnospiraceae bacterium]|nr:DUF1292 domain-containing protein [Lachnospiraceae bacterium]
MIEKLSFEDAQTGLAKEFFILAETVIKGSSYLLVTENEEGDSDALILKAIPTNDGEIATYETVIDEKELNDAMNAFGEMLDDIKFE